MNLEAYDDMPVREPLHRSKSHGRREAIKQQRTRPTICYKLNYATEKAAMTARSVRVKQGILRGKSELNVYRCKRCHFWHLTSQPKRHG